MTGDANKNKDFEEELRNHVNDFLIPKYEKKMPIRLADTYSGLILERWEIVMLLKKRRDYRRKVDDAISEAKTLAVPIDPQNPYALARPKRDELDAFIAEFLAYAMFSHRWRDREPSLRDVRNSAKGIYSMVDGDVSDPGKPTAFRLAKPKNSNLPTGIQKLQEFCCLAAKCGFRWAWSDTVCIDKEDFPETSESINSMFLWYRCSELTIVYLDDVDDVEDGRFMAMDEEGGRWFQDSEIRSPFPPTPSQEQRDEPAQYQQSTGPLPPLPPSYPSAPSDIYDDTLETKEYVSLQERLQDTSFPRLKAMQPDTQVERPQLGDLLAKKFPSVKDCKDKGKYGKLPIWVRRGWTLQEMVASKRLRFYSKQWTLLEEAEDPDTEEAEAKIFISSFKYRAQLVDHRRNDLWCDALVKTTGVPKEDLIDLRPGTKDVRTRLLWAARRTTTKVEDMAYCLLGIFDVSLPAIYGEGPRAFFRLQEELMKRTGDVSLFDWCGRSSAVNSFLAHEPECFLAPSIPEINLPPSNESPIKLIFDLFCIILNAPISGVLAAAMGFRDRVQNLMKSPPQGHNLTNGELNVSLFEHQVLRCAPVECSTPGDGYHHYKIDSFGLVPTTVTFTSQVPNLARSPTQYFLCRAWDRHTTYVFEIILEFLGYILEDAIAKVPGIKKSESDSVDPTGFVVVDEKDALDNPESKMHEEMRVKRQHVLQFFKGNFPVYLVHVSDRRRVRVNTVNRVEGTYPKLGFDFTVPLKARSVL